MIKLIFRQQAIMDLNDIWLYTFNVWSEIQADKYYESLEFGCNQIANNPDIGKEYEEIDRKLLGFRSGKHIIFYHVLNKHEVEIIRILHERMDLINQLKK